MFINSTYYFKKKSRKNGILKDIFEYVLVNINVLPIQRLKHLLRGQGISQAYYLDDIQFLYANQEIKDFHHDSNLYHHYNHYPMMI